MKRPILCAAAVAATAIAGLWLFAGRASAWGQHSYLDSLEAGTAFIGGTVPPSGPEAGDLNPYGVAVVPFDERFPTHGELLVSNFNDAGNTQANGSTIVSVDRLFHKPHPFFDAASPIGLTTALLTLRAGFAVVGSAPRVEASPPTVGNGALIFLDLVTGHTVLTLSDSALINGPWDATVDDRDADRPRLFVSNALSGTVVRIALRIDSRRTPPISIESITKIASGFATRTDAAALVIGPTGLALDEKRRQLFVADTGNNRIQVVDADTHWDQGAGATVFAGPPLAGPLGLVHVPGWDHLVAVNGDAIATTPATPPNLAVEISESGRLVATRQLDNGGTPGALFGITLTTLQGVPNSLVFVDDNDNTVRVIKPASGR